MTGVYGIKQVMIAMYCIYLGPAPMVNFENQNKSHNRIWFGRVPPWSDLYNNLTPWRLTVPTYLFDLRLTCSLRVQTRIVTFIHTLLSEQNSLKNIRIKLLLQQLISPCYIYRLVWWANITAWQLWIYVFLRLRNAVVFRMSLSVKIGDWLKMILGTRGRPFTSKRFNPYSEQCRL